MKKYLYLIKKQKIKSWLKFWLLTNNKFNSILSNILEGTSFNLQNTVKRYFKIFNIFGNSVQDGEPSPSNPSEIHSVADDVNLFDVSNYTITYGGAIGFDVSNFEIGKQYTFSSNLPITDFKISNDSSGYSSVDNYVYNGFTNFTFTMARNSNIPSSETQYLFIALNITNFITDINDITNYNIKVQKGSISTPYSPYNQGTVTIKQRGKNLFTISNFQKSGYNETINNPLKGLTAGNYTISCQNKHSVGMAVIFSNEVDGTRIGGYFTGYNFGKDITNKTTSLTQEQLNANYLIFLGSDASITQEILENMQIQIEQGSTATSYEPYKEKDFTFQTSPLRSLPNGVKDTIEADGIHRRVGRVVLDGSDDEGWNYNGSPGGKSTFYIMVSDVINLSDNTDTSIRALCNKFVGRSASNMVTNNLSNSISVISNKRIYVSLNDNTITTGTGFKTWLSTHNTEVLYELAEEVIEPFTQQQAEYDKIKELYTFDGTTNIYSDDVPPYLQIQYYMKGE